MIIHPLASSSSGNACLIKSGETKILIDAGISYKQLCILSKETLIPDAIFVTHEHGDHINGVGITARKTQCKIYIPKDSYHAKQHLFSGIPSSDLYFINGGQSYIVNDELKIFVFSTRHDSKASVGYVVEELKTGYKLGYLTDTGFITTTIKKALRNCDIYFLEADYDEEELEKTSEYDDYLKERIKSTFGHLSNQTTIEYLNTEVDLDKVRNIILGHLSGTTNSRELLTSQINEEFPNYMEKFIIAPTKDKIILENQT